MTVSEYVFGIWCGLLVTPLFAAVPNTFQAGTAAQASQVNQNFADLDGRLQSHQAQIDQLSDEVDVLQAQIAALQAQPTALQVKADGFSIGAFVQILNFSTADHILRVASNTNYLFDVVASSPSVSSGNPDRAGELENSFTLYYETPDCSGQAYVILQQAPLTVEGTFAPEQGAVFRVDDIPIPEAYFYVPPGSQAVTFVVRAARLGGGCAAGGRGDTIEGFAAFPNDPDITGVSNQRFARPITIGR